MGNGAGDTTIELSSELKPLFRRGRRRMRTLWLSAIAQERGAYVLAAAIFIAAVGWLLPWTWPEPTAMVVVAVAAAGTLCWALFQRLPNSVVARAIDRSLATENALATALQFEAPAPFGREIHERAKSFSERNLNVAMPVPVRPRKVAILAALAVLLLAVVVIRNPQDARREETERESERVQEIADSLGAEADALRASADPGLAAVADQLDELAASLPQAEDVETAAALLEQAQEDLLLTLDADALAQRGAVQGLERSLDAQPFPGATPSDDSSASDQLASLADSLGELDEQDQVGLTSQLQDLADAQSVGDPDTASALEEAAEAITAGDLSAAEDALRSAAEAAETALESAAETSAVAAAAADAAQAAADLRQDEPGTAVDDESGEAEQGQVEGQGQEAGEGTPSGAPPAGIDSSGDTASTDAEPSPDAELDQIQVDSVTDGSDPTGAVLDSPSSEIGQDSDTDVPVDLDALRAELAQRPNEIPDTATNISGSEAATVASYFNELTEETQ